MKVPETLVAFGLLVMVAAQKSPQNTSPRMLQQKKNEENTFINQSFTHVDYSKPNSFSDASRNRTRRQVLGYPPQEPSPLSGIARGVLRDVFRSSSIPIFLRHVRTTNMDQLGEVVRIMFLLMNPSNRNPETVLSVLKSLDSTTFSELAVVLFRSLKEILGRGKDHQPFSYISEKEVMEAALLLHEIVLETDSDHILRLVDRIQNTVRISYQLFQDKEPHYDKNTLQKFVWGVMNDTLKVITSEQVSSRIPSMTDVFKSACLYFLNQCISDIKNTTTGMGPQDLIGNLTIISRHALAKVEEHLDVDEIGSYVEEGWKYLQTLDLDTAAELLTDTLQAEEPIGRTIDHFYEGDKKIGKESIKQSFRLLKDEIPKPVVSAGLKLSLLALQNIDPKMARLIAEYFAKLLHNNSSISPREWLSDATLNWINENLINTNDWNDLEAKIVNAVESLDGEVIQKNVIALANMTRLNGAALSATIVNAYNIYKDVLSNPNITNDLIPNTFENTTKLLASIKKTEFVYVFMDALKIVNLTQIIQKCLDLSSSPEGDLITIFENLTSWVKEQFMRAVNDADLLKEEEVSAWLSTWVKSENLKEICADEQWIQKVNQLLIKEEPNEVMDTLGKIFSRFRSSENGLNEKLTQELLQTLLKSKSVKKLLPLLQKSL